MDNRPLTVLRFSTFPLYKLADGSLTAMSAGGRQRMLNPAFALSQYGVETKLIPPDLYAKTDVRNADIVVFDKIAHAEHAEILLTLAQACQQHNIKALLDVCNDPFPKDNQYEFKQAYTKALLPYLNGLTVNHQSTTDYLKNFTDKPCYVCTETFEYKKNKVKPALFDNSPVKLLWFGTRSQVSPLLEQMSELQDLSAEHALTLNIFINNADVVHDFFKEFNSANLTITTEEWALDKQQTIIADYDMVLLPENRVDTCRGPTKCIEALHAGCPVVAAPTDFYQEFAEFISLDKRLDSGIKALLNNPEKSKDMTEHGQQYVIEHYSLQRVTESWLAAYKSTLNI